VKIPTFVLKRLYVAGSLRAAGDGLRFTLHNHMATATLTELRKLAIAGHEMAPERVRVRVGGRDVDVLHVSAEEPLVFARGEDVEVHVQGARPGGRTKVRLEARSAEFGELVIEFEDEVA
jgi:hypothetical protein